MTIWDKYIGNLTIEQIEVLMELKKVDPNVGLPFLQDIVFNISDEIVEEIKTSEKPYWRLYKEVPDTLPLRSYQTINVAYGFYSKGAILGDAYGLGKTLTAAGIINLRRNANKKTKPLILTLKDSLVQVQNELISATGMNLIATTGEKSVLTPVLDKLDECDGVVGTHSLLTSSLFMSEVALRRCFTDFYLDESSVVKNHKNEITKNTRALIQTMDLVIFLNATPIELDIMDLYTQLSLIDPKFVPARTTFENYVTKKTYKTCIPRKIGYKEKQLAEMRDKLSLRYNGYSRAMLFNYNIAEHNKIECIFVPCTKRQKQLVKETGQWSIAYNAPYLLDTEMTIDGINIPKLGRLIELMKELRGKPTFIYCRYKDIQYVIKDLLEVEGFKCGIINGDVQDTNERDSIKDAFNQGNLNCIISNSSKALNLSSGKVCIFYTLETNPQKMKQIEGRILRETQPVGREFYVLVTEKSEETRRMKNQMYREDRSASKVLNLDDGILKTCVEQILEHEAEIRKARQ